MEPHTSIAKTVEALLPSLKTELARLVRIPSVSAPGFPEPRRPLVDADSRGVPCFLLARWWLALSHLVTGALLCLTIIGIPLGVADIKMAGAALVPFGKEIVSTTQLGQPPPGAITV